MVFIRTYVLTALIANCIWAPRTSGLTLTPFIASSYSDIVSETVCISVGTILSDLEMLSNTDSSDSSGPPNNGAYAANQSVERRAPSESTMITRRRRQQSANFRYSPIPMTRRGYLPDLGMDRASLKEARSRHEQARLESRARAQAQARELAQVRSANQAPSTAARGPRAAPVPVGPPPAPAGPAAPRPPQTGPSRPSAPVLSREQLDAEIDRYAVPNRPQPPPERSVGNHVRNAIELTAIQVE